LKLQASGFEIFERFVQATHIKPEVDKAAFRNAKLIFAKEFKRAAQLHDSHGLFKDDEEAFRAFVSLHPPRKDIPIDEPSIHANRGAITRDNLNNSIKKGTVTVSFRS